MTTGTSVSAPPGGLRVDRSLLRLAGQLRAEVAEALATEETPFGEGGQPEAATIELARAVTRQALDERRSEGLAPRPGRDSRADEDLVVDLVIAMLFGLGVLQVYLSDPSVENIDVNGAELGFVTYADGRKEAIGPIAESDEELVAVVRAAGARFGLAERRFDNAQPELDLRLPDGSRLSAVMGVTEHPVIDIRRHRLRDYRLGDLVALGMLDTELAGFLGACVRAKRNLLVSGAMNAGKTTLLRALAAEIPPHERVVTIEQAFELGLDRNVERHPDCVAMEARPANIEGVGAIPMAQLVRRSLRMNASRVIVGEVLGDEVIPMLNVMSQGRSGSMATIHADSSLAVFRRIASYAVQAPERLPLEAVNLLIAGSIHFVVHVDIADPAAGSRGAGGGGRRQLSSVREIVDADGALIISNEVWRPGPGGSERATPLRDGTATLLAGYGYDARLPAWGAW